MDDSVFCSNIVTIRQHRTQRDVCVVRVRDSLQTYVGEWRALRVFAGAANADKKLRIFGHGARVLCSWGKLGPVLQNHMVLCGQSDEEEQENQAAIVVRKFHRLISFGVALPTDDNATFQLLRSSSKKHAPLLLTRHPPVLRHLLDQPCTVLEWRSADISLATLHIDTDARHCSIKCRQPIHDNEPSLEKTLIEKFCDAHIDKFCTMKTQQFGERVAALRVSLIMCNEAQRSDDKKLCCKRITLLSGSQSGGDNVVPLTVGRTAWLCSEYQIPCAETVLYRAIGGIAEWLNVELQREFAFFDNNNHEECASNYYNEQNEKLHSRLAAASKQKDIVVYSDSQALQVMKALQNKCDQHCTSNAVVRRRCDGFIVQFENLPALQFVVPSLFHLLQAQRDEN